MKDQSKQVIQNLIKEVTENIGFVRKGLRVDEIYPTNTALIDGVRLALSVYEPDTKFLELSKLQELVSRYSNGTEQEKEQIWEQLQNIKLD